MTQTTIFEYEPMSESKTYITMTEDEKKALNEALSREFGENRISQGAFVRLLAEERL